jgi:hypothetical protein
MQIKITDFQTQEILAEGTVEEVKAIYEEEEDVLVFGFVGNGVKITTSEGSDEVDIFSDEDLDI